MRTAIILKTACTSPLYRIKRKHAHTYNVICICIMYTTCSTPANKLPCMHILSHKEFFFFYYELINFALRHELCGEESRFFRGSSTGIMFVSIMPVTVLLHDQSHQVTYHLGRWEMFVGRQICNGPREKGRKDSRQIQYQIINERKALDMPQQSVTLLTLL